MDFVRDIGDTMEDSDLIDFMQDIGGTVAVQIGLILCETLGHH